MKNKIFLAYILTALFSSCTSDEISTTDNSENNNTIKLTGYSSAQSRISVGDKVDNYYQMLWNEGDRLGLFSKTPGAENENIEAVLNDESIDKKSGIFTAEGLNLLENGNTDLTIYYPYNIKTKMADDGESVETTLTESQIQRIPGASDHLCKNGFAYAKATITNGNPNATFTLKHINAYVKFIISTKELADCKLKSVSLYDSEKNIALSGKYSVNTSTGAISLSKETKPYATVSIDNPETLSKAQEVFLTTFPADFTGKKVYVVITLEKDDMSTITIPILKDGKALIANALNTIKIEDLKLSDNSCDWYEPIETRLLVGGWAYGESNCIITNISTSGVNSTISVKARGNFMEVTEPKFAKTILNCDLNNDHKMVGVNGAKTDISAVSKDYTITINAYKISGGYDGGCGQVAIYGDNTDTPIWSFIVWMTPKPEEYSYRNTGYVVLDRNIGTYMVGDNWKTDGVYFQWGRPTPFGWGAKDYYSKPTEATNIRFSIENPRYLLYTASVENTKSDWYLGAWTGARTDRKDDMWGNPNESDNFNNPSDGHKSIYDPCPKGYRVVSPAVLAEVEKNGVYEKKSIGTIKYCYDGTNYTYWPLAGCRWGSNPSDRSINNSTTSACYWSNSPATNYANEKDQGGSALYYKAADNTWTHSAGRSHAFSIRCMKDTENR